MSFLNDRRQFRNEFFCVNYYVQWISISSSGVLLLPIHSVVYTFRNSFISFQSHFHSCHSPLSISLFLSQRSGLHRFSRLFSLLIFSLPFSTIHKHKHSWVSARARKKKRRSKPTQPSLNNNGSANICPSNHIVNINSRLNF